jgi:hypothetical protein
MQAEDLVNQNFNNIQTEPMWDILAQNQQNPELVEA